MTNFWKGLTKQQVNDLIDLHKGAKKMNEMQQKVRKQEAAEALRTHLLEAEAVWWDRPGHVELFNDICSKSFIAMTDEDVENITEEISKMAWQQDISDEALGAELNDLAECLEGGYPNTHVDTLRNLIFRIGVKLNLAKAQATDGYNQAQQAFKLLEQVYSFLVRLNKVTYKAGWIHNYVVALVISIEEFLPGLKEEYS